MPDAPLEKFQNLLRELFQFDCQGLDFGIYRVLNLKRDEIEKFIGERLPQVIDEAFSEYASADQQEVQRELEEKRKEIEETAAKLGQQAFEPSGQLVLAIRESPLGKRFIELETRTKAGRVAEDLKTGVYNDLYAFFSRYYDDGDIFSKPRRGRVEIPFTGHEDVVLYWANKDQYYIKTGEQFKSYRFSANPPTSPPFVEFKLNNIAGEQNNNRGEKRYYVLASKSPLNWDEATKTLSIFFEYRPLTDTEKQTFGKTETQKPQEKLNDQAEQRILKSNGGKLPPEVKARLAQSAAEDKPSLLRQHLTRFSRKNTTDFFIHKNLRGFLAHELDDFIKTEVLRVGELLAHDRGVAERQLARARVVRTIAEKLIAFLAQIEDFQKKVFEKRKFVVRTDYCATLDRIPEELWDEVLRNKDQIVEWRQLYALNDLLRAAEKKKLDRDFLHAHDKLVIDTRHFGDEFKWRLLGKIDNLDAALNGILIKSENFQALALLLAKYRECVKCIHIDPPYNTATSGFLYKNNYQHSSWLAMMENRIAASLLMLDRAGAFLCHIDENEYENVHILCTELGIPDGGTVIWDKKNPMLGRKGVATQHEYVLWRTWQDSPVYLRSKNVEIILKQARASIRKHGGVNEKSRREFAKWMRKYEGLSGGERAYNLLNDDGRVFQSVAMGAPEPRADPKFHIPLVHPVTKKKCPVPANGWSRAPETLKDLIEKDEILFGEDERVQPRRKIFLTEESQRQLASVISDSSRGKSDLESLGLGFPYCHPVSLYEELTGACATDSGDVVLDYFAGSATTAHAIINLNRDDGEDRKYVLAEVDEQFDTVMLPRIKKVAFCENWKEGKPVGGKGISQLVKYHVLEQYEDALNNLELPRAKDGELALKQFGDEYLLRYMLEFETAGSASLLSLKQMRHPFAYKLKVQKGDASVEHVVDLVETFNYLLGLQVKKLGQFRDGERLYRASLGEQHNQKSAVVIWRDLERLEEDAKALQRDAEFIQKEILPALLGKESTPDRLLANGPCIVDGAEAIEPEFHRLMFAPIS